MMGKRKQIEVLKKHKADSDARIDELLTMVRVTEAERDEFGALLQGLNRQYQGSQAALSTMINVEMPHLHAKIKDLGRKVWLARRRKRSTWGALKTWRSGYHRILGKSQTSATASAAWKRASRRYRDVLLAHANYMWELWYDRCHHARDIARRMMHERDAAQKKNEDWLGLYCEIDPREIKAKLSEARAERDELRPAANKWARYGKGYDAFIRQIDELQADNADLKASINLYADQVDRQAKEVQDYHRDNAKLRAALEQAEYVRDTGLDESFCAWCEYGENAAHEHEDDCPRQLALGLADGEDGDRCKDTGNMIDECECTRHAAWCFDCNCYLHLVRPGKWQCKVCG